MNNQKRIFEILIYVLLLAVGLFFYLNDEDLSIENNKDEPRQEADELQEVPQELIDYNFKFEGD